jgi:hypothetical protein
MSTSNTKPVRLPNAESATADPGTAATAATKGGGRLLGWAATVAIVASILLMIGSGLLRASWMPPPLAMPHPGPPWELTTHISDKVIIVGLWIAAVLATAGVFGGLVAVRRGLTVPIRTLIVAVFIGAVVLILLPPVGSTDILDYAVYGHIVALGHSPYVMTPLQYRNLVHLKFSVPLSWNRDPSVYGPLATGEQYLAAKIAGASLARTAFVLKVINAIAFVAVSYAADRIFRGDRAARLRAHLLWTVNPLIIWSVIAAGHIDLLSAAVGVAGLLIADRWTTASPVLRGLAAGLCVGAAADIKIDYLLFALAVAWALFEKPTELLAAGLGVIAVLVPSYAGVGLPAVKALANRSTMGFGYGFYGFFLHHLGISLKDAVPLALILILPVMVLALLRIPSGFTERSAVRAAVALSLAAWLVWPHQFAWYTVMVIVALVFYPASRLDWLALAWFAVVTFADIPGLGAAPDRHLAHWILDVQYQNLTHLMPLVMLVALICLIVWSFNGKWNVVRT